MPPKPSSIGAERKTWTNLFPAIEAEGRTFSFKPSLSVEVSNDGDYWVGFNSDFDIETVAQSFEGAIDAVGVEIASLWDHIATEDDKNLTADAQRLKQKLLKRIHEAI